MLTIRCPECGSNQLRSSLSQTFTERLWKVLGYFQLRCKDCDHRFKAQIWGIGNLFWAKCPRCYRLDLSTWSPQYYRAPTYWLLLMRLGWKRHRCEYCRHNFIGLRRARYKFVRRRDAAPE